MRINIFGGPGSGKSTIASWLYSELNIEGHSVSLVTEFVKNWAYLNKTPKGMDQLLLLGMQASYEDAPLRGGIRHVISESPLMLSCFYAWYLETPYWQEEVDIVLKWDAVHPPLNIFLDRTGIPYDRHGRFQDKEEASEVDRKLEKFLQDIYGEDGVTKISTLEKGRILAFVRNMINSCE